MKKVWEVKRLGDICNIFSGGTPNSKIDNYWNGSIPFVTLVDTKNKYVYSTTRNITDEGLKNSSAILLPIDTVLLSTRATIGEVSIAKTPLCTNQGYKNFVCNKEILLPEFLYYGLILLKDYLLSLCKGAVYAEISKQGVSELKLPIPSLLEQQRIVKILDTTFAKIDTIKQNAERNLQNAKELFQSLLKKELNGKNKWPVTKIIEVCTLKSGNSLSQTLFSEKGEIPYIKVAEMNLVENIPQITSSPYMVKRKNVLKAIFPKGSIIFPKRGGAIATNKKRITNVEICADLNIMGIIPNNTIKSEYLYYYFLNVDLGKLSNGTTIPQINNGDIAPLKIFLPPLSEQEQIVTKLDSLSEKCKELENNYRQTITDCDEMIKSILAKAFNGEL